jgi:S1-C subfamily serine protease
MKKHLVLTLSALCLFAVNPSLGRQGNRALDTANSIVQIVVKYTDEKAQEALQAIGTGFFVSDDLIVTAAHVYWQAGQFSVEKKVQGMFARKITPSGKFLVPIGGGGIDSPHDLTSFKIDAAEIKKQWPAFTIKPLALSKDEAEMGEQVLLVAFFSQDPNPIAAQGIVATSRTTDDLFLDIHANPGNSGGPIVSLASGEVVGVQLALIPTTYPGSAQSSYSGICKAVRAKYIKELISR